jgi:hypothetical protein
MLEGGGYFVYPGSPISITKREIGQRKVNIFEVGGAPKEYPLNSPHFEEVDIEPDPLKDNDPLYVVKEHIDKVHPKACIILNIGGYINSEKIKMKEPQLVEKIKQIASGRTVEEHLEFKDIQSLLEDDLFKSFSKKLEGQLNGFNLFFGRNEDGKILEAEKLSGGAYDQLYLSIRLALGEKLLKGKKGFFIMDDPFVKADSDRLKRQIEMLWRIKDLGWQILYFSAKGEIKDILIT